MRFVLARWVSFVALSAIGWATPSASAQEEFAAQELTACGADIAKHCAALRRGGGRIIQCLQQNRTQIAPDCKAAVTPSDFNDEQSGVSITVAISEIRSNEGAVIVTLSDSPVAFPRGRRTVIAPAKLGTLHLQFKNLKPGKYALTAFHDENDNGQFDASLTTGVEGFGATNGASAAADFGASAIEVMADKRVSLSLQYAFPGVSP